MTCIASFRLKDKIIIAGDKMGPSKFQKANALKIPIIDEYKFLQFII